MDQLIQIFISQGFELLPLPFSGWDCRILTYTFLDYLSQYPRYFKKIHYFAKSKKEKNDLVEIFPLSQNQKQIFMEYFFPTYL